MNEVVFEWMKELVNEWIHEI